MRNYLTEIELDKSKTYYSFVDVVVRFNDRETLFMEKLPTNKKEMNFIIKNLNPKNDIKNIEIIRKTFRLKDKWLVNN